MKPISIYIVDDHKIFRDGISSLIKYEEGMEVIGSAGSVQAFCNEILKCNPDVILMDISIGEELGTDATKWIKEKKPEAKVLVLSMHHEEQYVQMVLDSGADGFILKELGTEEMIQAIKVIAGGETYYSQSVSKVIVSQLVRGKKLKKEVRGKKLTSREIEVLTLIAAEKNNQEIADMLFISIRTVDSHRRNLLEKIGVKNTAGLVKFAVREGIIEL